MRAFAQPQANGKPVRVLIADEHPAAREGLALRIEQDTHFQMAGEVGDIPNVLPSVATASPDVVVLEFALRGGSGFELLKTLRAGYPTVHTLVWSRYRESVYAER